MEDVYATRMMLEPYALRLSLERGGDEWRAGLDAAWGELEQRERRRPRTPLDLEPAHSDFHHALLAACGSPSLLRICGQLPTQSLRFRVLTRSARPGGLAAAQAEHAEMYRACIARDETPQSSSPPSTSAEPYEHARRRGARDADRAHPARAGHLDSGARRAHEPRLTLPSGGRCLLEPREVLLRLGMPARVPAVEELVGARPRPAARQELGRQVRVEKGDPPPGMDELGLRAKHRLASRGRSRR